MEVSQEEIEKLFTLLKEDAKSSGYNLNPDEEFTKGLVKGLLVNQKRYGYKSCPCRLASGDFNEDLDIICPCDYRDADIDDWGSCYCGLYVDDDIKNGRKSLKSIPERRNVLKKDSLKNKEVNHSKNTGENKFFVNQNLSQSGSVLMDIFLGALNSKKMHIWRCKVCGYLCAREKPPQVCPICKASKERFEKFF